MNRSRNEGGIQRGDKKNTGDLEARPTEGTGPEGSGVSGGSAGPTATADALDGTNTGIAELGGDSDLEDLTIHGATDPDLGLTDIGDVPAGDWAADTGSTRSGEASAHGVDRQLVDTDRMPDGRRVEIKREKKQG